MTEASPAMCVGFMTLEDFIERHKGVRRTVLAICVTWTSLAICFGIWVMLDRGLAMPETTFLTAVIALMQAPVGFYFYNRGKDEWQQSGRR